MKAREAAFKAVHSALSQKSFVADMLDEWERAEHPNGQDLRLAWEIASGTVRMALALEHFAKQCAGRSKLNLKPKERALLYTALYQHAFMSRVPLYAIVDETVALTKRFCHSSFAGFLNAVLRKLSQTSLSLPQGDSVDELSVRTSFPPYFVKTLIADYGLEASKKILEAENLAPAIMARIRPRTHLSASINTPYLQIVQEHEPRIARLTENDRLPELARSQDLYLQNATPAQLVWNLAKDLKKPPESILDLCASPGGKLLALHDLFPQASLTANDVSEDKLRRLKENCSKYGLEAAIYCGKGEDFKAAPGSFDLIVLDVPCSNSGVLNKRPEARWRLSEEQLKQLEETQLRLLERASQLVAPEGEVWYLTCSILKQENEAIVTRACKLYGCRTRTQMTLLPDQSGWEGGFGAALFRSNSMDVHKSDRYLLRQ
ncbi:MAG: methyltransferase domain-containing protein [Parachlamydia sp.]|nr:methyltransferase domain-containing protein [Parachlamydia sp.]